MGRTRDKRLCPSAHRKSLKKGWKLRRKLLRLLNNARKARAEAIAANINLSVKSVSDINSEVGTRIQYCLDQVTEEKRNDNEELVKEYEKDGLYNRDIKYDIDTDNLVLENQCFSNNEDVEVYDEYIEIYDEVEKEEKEEEKSAKKETCNENIENIKNIKNLENFENSENIENFVNIGMYSDNKEDLIINSIYNENTENIEMHCDNKEDLIINSTYNENTENIEMHCNDKEDLTIDNRSNHLLVNKMNNIENNKQNIENLENIGMYCDNKEDLIIKSTYNENTENIEMHCNDKKDLIKDNRINHLLVNKMNNIENNKRVINIPEGRFIVNILFMWNEIQRTFNNHHLVKGIKCQFRYWQLVNFRRRGLLIQLFFKCQMCDYETSVFTDPIDSEKLNINRIATAACIESKISFPLMTKLCANMNIQYMSQWTYYKYRNNLIREKAIPQNIKTES